MEKLKLGVIFGGMSTENEVSVISANSILKNLDRNLNEIYPIYIDKSGDWWEYIESDKKIELGEKIDNKKAINNVLSYLKQLDIVFPVLHGLYGEDGTIQGLLELIKRF